jgi:general secretion pathway protein D
MRAAASAILCLALSAQAQETPTPQVQAPAPSTAAAHAVPETPGKEQSQAAEDAYLAGARLLDRKDLAGAEKQFAKALKLNPSNNEYALALALAREHHVTELIQESGQARVLGQTDKAEKLLAEAHALDPQNDIVTQHTDAAMPGVSFSPKIEAGNESWIRQAPAIAGAVTLEPKAGTQNFHIHSDVQDVLQRVFSSYGIRASFDESVRRQDLRFDLEDATYQQATPILLKMAGLFAVALDPKRVLIAKDTTENRQRFEHQLQETIYIPAMTPEQMQELGTIIRTVFDVKQLSVETLAGDLVLRAPEETLTAVNLTLADLLDGGSQVMLELNLYSVDRTRQRNIGVQLPQQLGIYNVAAEARNIVNQNQTLVNQAIAQGLVPANASDITIALALIGSGLVQSTLLTNTIGFFGGGLTQTGVTANLNLALNLGLNSSDARALDNVQLRVGDRQAATFRAGTRYPITTSTYSSGVPSSSALAGVTINGVSASSLLNQVAGSSITIPQIQYEDLGLTLKATPTVQKSGEISMKLDLKIEALAGSSVNNIPILASRQFVSDVTVADGDTALLFSTVTKTESAAISGIPGLGELPGFQTATANTTNEVDSSEIVLLITPHIVRRRSSVIAGPRISLNSSQKSD